MNMSAKAEKIMERYLKGYVTEEQLIRYKELGVITQEEYDYIYSQKHPEQPEEPVIEEA